MRKNELEAFQREPLELRRYLQFIHLLKKRYGSIMTFILSERLGWEEGDHGEERGCEGRDMFENEAEWKILWNDWPYGIDARIVHLVVWTKFELKDDEATGLLKPKVKDVIQTFVQRIFGGVCGEENVGFFMIILIEK